jgi:hypothetical protein
MASIFRSGITLAAEVPSAKLATLNEECSPYLSVGGRKGQGRNEPQLVESATSF